MHPDLIRRIAMTPSSIPISDLWLLIAYSLTRQSLSWLSEYLWDIRVSQYVSSDVAMRRHCKTCGCLLHPAGRSDRLYCRTACRLKAHRLSRKGELSVFQQAREDAVRHLSVVDDELSRWRRWYHRNMSLQILPPDLLRVDHLPVLPGRCGRGCHRGVGCSHTDGSACLFSGTRGESGDE